jgi:hypothetical protein
MRFIHHHILLTVVTMQTLVAGGPIYSRFGLGELIYFGSNRSDAMGGISIGLSGDGFINRINPAGLSKISLTRFSGSFEYARISSDDGAARGQYNRGHFKGIAFAIPISTPHGVVLMGDITPFSTINYATLFTDNSSAYPSTQTFYGSGGVNSFNLSLSYQPAAWISVGAKLNYYAGTTRQRLLVDFTDASFTDSDVHSTRYLSGFGSSFGVQYSGFSNHLGLAALSPLTLGVVVTSPARLSGREERIVYYTPVDFDTTNVHKTSAQIPPGIGLGFSYVLGGRYVVGGDIFTQQWEGVNLFGEIPVGLKRRTRIGLGFEALPPREPTDYWSRVHFRAGIYYHLTYQKVNGHSINETGGTVGGGFPIGPDVRMNIGLHYGVRGTTLNKLQQDKFLRITVSFSASEAWFVKIEED